MAWRSSRRARPPVLLHPLDDVTTAAATLAGVLRVVDD
jgi:hypothetical protein